MSVITDGELAELLRGFELSLVTGSDDKFDFKLLQGALNAKDDATNFAQLCECVYNHDFEGILNSNVVCDVFKMAISKRKHDSLSSVIKSAAESIKENYVSSLLPDYTAFLVGLSSLQEFVRWNWTGPIQDEVRTYNCLVSESSTSCENDTLSYLSPHHEAIYHNVRYPELLMMSKIFLSSVETAAVRTCQWWFLRCSMIHQHVLLEKSPWLYKEMVEAVKLCFSCEWIQSNFRASLQSNIENGLMHLFYHEIAPAKQHFSEALKLTGLDIELCGAFGKRTQFQEKAVPQLFLKLHQNSNFQLCDSAEVDNSNLPKDLPLEDEVLLNGVKFIDLDEKVVQKLAPEEQVVILSYCCWVQKSSASDELLTEQVEAYLECLLSRPSVWCIQMKSLIMRSKVEKKKSRKVERAMMQLESLLSCLNKQEPSLKSRLFMFYSTQFPPCWILKKELADLLISLGSVKTALSIYLMLELWEDVVHCYQILDQNEKAAIIVRDQLKKNETPTLWCILGDVTGNIEYYHKGWDLSNHQSARAQHSLAYHHYKKKEYKLSIPHFEESLKLNHLQPNVWFSLAFAASQVGDYALAAKSYRHVVGIDPDNFEAWNNLSNSYIKLNQKLRAYHTLQEALKCNFEDWRIWENFLLVCLDVGAFEDAIQAWHRLLDIKGKHEDSEILAILVKAVTTDTLDIHGQPASRLKQKILQLFGRLTSIIPNNADIWKLYARLYATDPEYPNSKDVLERVINFLYKSQNCMIRTHNWEKDATLCESIVLSIIELGELYYRYLDMVEGTQRVQGKSTSKLMMKNILIRVEKQLQDFHSADVEKLEGHLKLLKEILAKIESL